MPSFVLRGLAPALALCATTLGAQTDKTDHPLVSRYAGSEITAKTVDAFTQYKAATAMAGPRTLSGPTLEGKVTRIVYTNPAERSTLEIMRNYEQALGAAGFAKKWSCADATCGPAYTRSAWNQYNGLFAAADGDPRYYIGSVATPAGEAWVAVMVGRRRTQLDVVEITAMETDMVVADADALSKALDREGRAAIGGIHFDVDKAVVLPASKPALDEVAKLLRTRADLRFYVVGHTDMTGDFAHNRTLSDARAKAVVTTLVRDYAIAASRLEGYGVGPLSPVASNGAERGRKFNRRVELVVR